MLMTVDAAADNSSSPEPIKARYLLVIHIPVYCDSAGQRFLDPLWLKDLKMHLDYIVDFSIACPRVDNAEFSGLIKVNDPRIKFIDLPGKHTCTLMLPVTMIRLWRGIRSSDVVHGGLGGWFPLSLGNLTALFAVLCRKYFLVIVESSTWRPVRGARTTWKARVKSAVSEAMNRYCVSVANMGIFTQAEYKTSLMTRRAERGHIIHASWIDEENIASTQCVEESWEKKLANLGSPLRILFAGRLTLAKGVIPLLDALDMVEAAGCPIHLDILGQGDLMNRCLAASGVPRVTARVTMLGVVPYGPEFFSLIRNYHAIVVPSLTDEQPRIVYDAYSQGVPVLASDTPGLRDCVIDGETGKFFLPNDADSITRVLKWSAQNIADLKNMGFAGLALARRMTHREMHFKRWVLLDRDLRSMQRDLK